MIKAAGLMIMALACCGMGYAFGRDLNRRLENLRSLKKMMTMLGGEIKYARAPLPEAFDSMSRRIEKPFSVFLSGMAEEMEAYEGKTFSEIWQTHVEMDLQKTSLTKKDKEQLKQMGDNLGYLDYEMQQNTITLYLEQLELELQQTQKTAAEKIRVYHCLGMMGGLFLVILFL